MPQIRLKPQSPDYDAPAKMSQRGAPRHCDMPGCTRPGEHRAPKNRALTDYHWFCLDHVQDYNTAWDFFAGMADRDIERHILASFYGDRPTWRSDDYRGLEATVKERVRAFRDFVDEAPAADPAARPKTPEDEALATLGLANPVTFEAIKKRYRELVKQYHPDHHARTPDPAREDRLKQINMAYTLLKMTYSERFTN